MIHMKPTTTPLPTKNKNQPTSKPTYTNSSLVYKNVIQSVVDEKFGKKSTTSVPFDNN
jgi:hypothetical protein